MRIGIYRIRHLAISSIKQAKPGSSLSVSYDEASAYVEHCIK